MGSHKAPPHCHPESIHNPHGSYLTQGAAPSDPQQASRRREALITQGKGCSPPYTTSAAVGQAYGVRKGRNPEGQPAAGEAAQNRRPRKKSTAQGVKSSAAPKTPQTQQTELHRSSRTGNWSQKSLRNPLRITCGRTRRGKTTGTAGRGTEANSSQWLNNSQPRPQQEERKKTKLRRSRKDPHTNAGPTSEEVRSENPLGQLPQAMA